MKNFPIAWDELADIRHWDTGGMPFDLVATHADFPGEPGVTACGRPLRGLARATINTEHAGKLSLNCPRCQTEYVAWRLRHDEEEDRWGDSILDRLKKLR